MSQRNAWDREYHDEVQGDEEEKDVQRRKQQLSTRQEDDGGPERQHDGAPTQGRTVTEQKKIENLIAMQRREEGMQTNRSRSSSRRDRRKRIEKAMRDGKLMHTSSLEGIEEADASMELMSQRPFERIGPDSTSMDGPVTHARAMRGEIPLRGSDPRQPKYISEDKKEKFGGGAAGDTDGLKLSLEANLDIEIELKASIRGDLTLSL
ncbi:hypothetical protein Q7P36_005691 [Cladosporium allicinum]|jgi:hypothetical protein